ncbi:MAG TPA: hypothetical protein PKJ44_11885, partial [Thauera aminoaromatica]|nr:hypothetical protein [Thauera aminoaromatica]
MVSQFLMPWIVVGMTASSAIAAGAGECFGECVGSGGAGSLLARATLALRGRAPVVAAARALLATRG